MIKEELRNSVLILHMSHGKANALDFELCQELARKFGELGDSSTGAVVLTGHGSIFSAGVDLLRMLDGGPEYVREFLPALHNLCETIFGFSKPIVAAINGHAIAGGCILAGMADKRVMARASGSIGVPELLVGLPFPPAPLEILRFAVPPAHFNEVVYDGTAFEPDQALERGLVDEIVNPQNLLDRSVDLAKGLASLVPSAFSLTKTQIRQPVMDRIRAAQSIMADEIERAWTSSSAMESIRRYVSRTFKREKS